MTPTDHEKVRGQILALYTLLLCAYADQAVAHQSSTREFIERRRAAHTSVSADSSLPEGVRASASEMVRSFYASLENVVETRD